MLRRAQVVTLWHSNVLANLLVVDRQFLRFPLGKLYILPFVNRQLKYIYKYILQLELATKYVYCI